MKSKLYRITHSCWFLWVCAVSLAVAAVCFYPAVRSWLLDQSTIYTSVISNVTVNFVLLFFLIGVGVDVVEKQRKWSKTKGMVVLVVVLMIVIVLFRLLGFKTRFG